MIHDYSRKETIRSYERLRLKCLYDNDNTGIFSKRRRIGGEKDTGDEACHLEQ